MAGGSVCHHCQHGLAGALIRWGVLLGVLTCGPFFQWLRAAQDSTDGLGGSAESPGVGESSAGGHEPVFEWDFGWVDALPQDPDLRVQRLQVWLKSDDPEVLSLALLELRNLAPWGREAIPRAVELLADGRECLTFDGSDNVFVVRRFAKGFLRSQGTEAVAGLAKQLVADADDRAQNAAIDLLSALGDEAQAAAAPLAALYRSDRRRVSLLRALNTIDAIGQEVVAVGMDLLDELEEYPRSRMVECLGSRRRFSGFVGERLLAATYDPEPIVRQRAALALANLQFDPERSVRRLCQLLADENGGDEFGDEVTVSSAAITALQRFPAQRQMMVPDLVRSLRKTYSPEAVEMLRAVGPGLESQIGMLRDFVADSQWELLSRVELAHLLRHFGLCLADAEFLQELADLLNEPHDRWRVVAAAGLVALSVQPPPQAFVILDKALSPEPDDIWLWDRDVNEAVGPENDMLEFAEIQGESGAEEEEAPEEDASDFWGEDDSDSRFDGEQLDADERMTLAVQLVARLRIRDATLLEGMRTCLRNNVWGFQSPAEIRQLASFLGLEGEGIYRSSFEDAVLSASVSSIDAEELQQAWRHFPGFVTELIQTELRDPESSEDALQALQKLGRQGRRLIPDLLSAMQSPGSHLPLGLETLVALGPHDEPLPDFVRQALQDREPRVRALAARSLALSSGRRPDDVALLRKSLTDEFITVRCAAIRALVTIDPDDPQTAADLRSLASDASELVRLTAERLSAR